MASEPDPELVTTAAKYAIDFGLEEELLIALIWQESRFCPTAISPKGAVGLGQIMPGTARNMGIDPYNPLENIWGSAYYLREQYYTFGSWHLAIAAYNAGPQAVKNFEGIPPYKETENFVKEVLLVYQDLRKRWKGQ